MKQKIPNVVILAIGQFDYYKVKHCHAQVVISRVVVSRQQLAYDEQVHKNKNNWTCGMVELAWEGGETNELLTWVKTDQILFTNVNELVTVDELVLPRSHSLLSCK